MSGKDADNSGAGRASRLHPEMRIFEYDTIPWRDPEKFRGSQVNFRVGFRTADLVPVHDYTKIMPQPSAVQNKRDIGRFGIARHAHRVRAVKFEKRPETRRQHFFDSSTSQSPVDFFFLCASRGDLLRTEVIAK